MATKPTEKPRWATSDVFDPGSGTDNVAEPSESKKDRGWDDAEIPPRQWWNWLWRIAYRWIDWLDGTTIPLTLTSSTINEQKADGTGHTHEITGFIQDAGDVAGFEKSSVFYRKLAISPQEPQNVLSDLSYAGSPGTAVLETETVGPTGSGASVIWSAMDELPSDTKSIMVKITLEYDHAAVAASDDFEIAAYFGDGDITDADLQQSRISISVTIDDNDGDSAAFKDVSIVLLVPLNDDNVFKCLFKVFRLTGVWLNGYGVQTNIIGFYR